MNKPLTRGGVYSYDFGKQLGSLQNGLRPVVVVQNNFGNLYSPTTIVAAITTSDTKKKLPVHFPLKNYNKYSGLDPRSILLFEQVFTVNKNELSEEIGYIDLDDNEISKALSISVGLNNWW